MDKIQVLKQLLSPLAGYSLHSRIHKLKTYATANANVYVKRDDELGFGISGSKVRKYASLLPHLLSQQITNVAVIGGAYSNHVLGFTQLLIENNIKPHLFLLESKTEKPQGNFLLTSLLVAPEQIHWISRSAWPKVEDIATNYLANKEHAMLIPEGACMPAALPGACTLVLDILQNEQQLTTEFQHLFIDAGTGLTAIATILVFAWLRKKTQVHVLLLADTETVFINKLQQFQAAFELLIQDKLAWNDLLAQFSLHLPTHARSFGAVNTTIFQQIKTIARIEGFFTDPIYSAKLFFAAKKTIQDKNLSGNCLIIHSGGGLTLMGSQEQLLKII